MQTNAGAAAARTGRVHTRRVHLRLHSDSSTELGTARKPMTAAEARSLLERELPTVDALVDSVCRRYGLWGDDADSFASEVRFRLVDQEYAVIRKFSGRASLKTYLSTVIANIHRDRYTKEVGKWRPSAAAKRHGAVGVRLDALLNRDGLSLDEAVRHVVAADDLDVEVGEARGIAYRIPRRPRRTFQTLDPGLAIQNGVSPEVHLDRHEAEEAWRCVLRVLDEVMEVLPEQDRLILSLKFHEELSVAAIARTLQIEQKPLYRRLNRCYRKLRTRLEEAGVDRARVTEIIDSRVVDLFDGTLGEGAGS